MPTNIVDVSTFSAPIVAPVDGDPANGPSIQVVAQGLANRTRKLKDDLDLAAANIVAIGEIIQGNNDGGSRERLINIFDGIPSVGASGSLPGWTIVTSGIFGGSPCRWSSITNSASLVFPIRVDEASVLNAVYVLVQPNSGGQMGMGLFRNTGVSFSAPTAPTTAQLGVTQTTGGTGLQVLQITGLSELISNESTEFYLAVGAGGSAGANTQYIWAAAAGYTDNGPRNY